MLTLIIMHSALCTPFWTLCFPPFSPISCLISPSPPPHLCLHLPSLPSCHALCLGLEQRDGFRKRGKTGGPSYSKGGHGG